MIRELFIYAVGIIFAKLKLLSMALHTTIFDTPFDFRWVSDKVEEVIE